MLLGHETCNAQWAQTARVTVVRPTKDHVAAATALPAMRYRSSVIASSKHLGSFDGDGRGKQPLHCGAAAQLAGITLEPKTPAEKHVE